jgi:uncharacterized membrane protein
MGFIEQYFLDPISEKSGYNLVNTGVYAAIALGALYAIYRVLKDKKFQIDEYFVKVVVAFVLFGSIKRVITDAVDSGVVFDPLVKGLFAYNIFNITPGIYVFVGGLFLLAMAIDYLTKRKVALWIGVALFLIHALILGTIYYRISFAYFAITMVLALIPFAAVYSYFKNKLMPLVVFSQALDGAATFIAIEVNGNYFEQHVFSNLIGQNSSFLYFYLFKIFLSIVFVYLVDREKLEDFDKNYLLTIALVFGLAPGIRDILRLTFGV